MRQFSTVQYIDTCVGVWKLYFRQQMYLDICLWIFLSIDDKCWLQHMMSTTVYCCAQSNSKCKHDKKDPLAIFQNHAVLTVPFLSLHHWRKAPPWSCVWPHKMGSKFQHTYCDDCDDLWYEIQPVFFETIALACLETNLYGQLSKCLLCNLMICMQHESSLFIYDTAMVTP